MGRDLTRTPARRKRLFIRFCCLSQTRPINPQGAHMTARLRHFAICVSDLEAAAEFYQKVFGLRRVGEETLEMGSGVYLTDGVVNLALLKGSPGSAMDGFVGSHHFGFIVDDPEAMGKAIEEHGGQFF